MSIMPFYDKLECAWKKHNSVLCVGLDPNLDKLPERVKKETYPFFQFNKAIIDATYDLVCCYKPQIAFYSAIGGEIQLEMTIQYIKNTYPDIPVILDAKRGDIGSVAEMYAKEAFDRYKVDAVTVNPYMGTDTLEPYLQRQNKGVVILCKTSNPGSRDLQELQVHDQHIYEIIAHKAQHVWNTNRNILLVVGATYPTEMKSIRKIAPDITFLVPGVGAQGGNPEAVIKNGIDKNGYGIIINSSRGIIYASNNDDYAEVARTKAKFLKEEINKYREKYINLCC
jgi:orotidine-5'-phosphate decarboxylase